MKHSPVFAISFVLLLSCVVALVLREEDFLFALRTVPVQVSRRTGLKKSQFRKENFIQFGEVFETLFRSFTSLDFDFSSPVTALCLLFIVDVFTLFTSTSLSLWNK